MRRDSDLLVLNFPKADSAVVHRAQVRAVTLDVAGVLVYPDHARVFPSARQGENWDAAMFSVRVRQDSRYDDVPWESVAATVGTTVARAQEYIERFHALHAAPEIWRAAPGAAELLHWLRESGIPFAAISNTVHPMAFEVLNNAGLIGPAGLTPDLVFDSSVFGVAKPDPRLFKSAFDKLGVPAPEVVHIGDSIRDDVEGATRAGALAVHIKPFGRCITSGHVDIVSLSDILKGAKS